MIAAFEARGQDNLFKLMMKPQVKQLVQKLAWQGGWTEGRQGWEAAVAELQLSGWTQRRRVVLRRRLPDAPPRTRKVLLRPQLELLFTEVVEGGKQRWKNSVLVTDEPWLNESTVPKHSCTIKLRHPRNFGWIFVMLSYVPDGRVGGRHPILRSPNGRLGECPDLSEDWTSEAQMEQPMNKSMHEPRQRRSGIWAGPRKLRLGN